tara:strand:- start:3804 stop:4709 length:906 start_codon:yes stop_codon:yes gene_type:complete
MKLFLHLGWGKAGATWLQSQVFSQNKIFKTFDKYKLHSLVDPNWTEYNAKNAKKVIKSITDEAKKHDVYSVVSAEGLVASLHHSSINHETMLKRIAEIYDGEIKIIFFIRRHEDILTSLYIERLEQLRNLSINDFIKQYDSQIRYSLCYSERIKFCQNIFGIHNVFIGALEQLNKTPIKLKDNLQTFIGKSLQDFDNNIKPNSKASYLAFEKTRWLTPLLYTKFHYLYQRFLVRNPKKPSEFYLNRYRRHISKNIRISEEMQYRNYLKKEINSNFGDIFLKDRQNLIEVTDIDIQNVWDSN